MIIGLTFCCNETINGGDYESTDQIVDRLDEHITKCPWRRLLSREHRALAGGELAVYDHSLRVRALRVRYDYREADG